MLKSTMKDVLSGAKEVIINTVRITASSQTELSAIAHKLPKIIFTQHIQVSYLLTNYIIKVTK